MRDKAMLLFLLVTPFFALGTVGITTWKAVYGLGILICAIKVLLKDNWTITKFRSVYFSGIFLFCLVFYGFIVGVVRNNSFESLASAYNIMVPALWLITIPYAANKVSNRFFQDSVFLLGLLASIITFYKWSELRGYLDFSINLNAFDSDWNIYLILILLLLSPEKYTKIQKISYFIIVLSSTAFTIGSGTRTLIFIYAYIIVLSVLLGMRKLIRTVFFGFSFTITFLALLPFLPEALQRRYQDFLSQVITLNIFKYNSGFDQSTYLRAQQRAYFKNVWSENQFFGTGIGQSNSEAAVVADTPYAFLAQFGLMGAFCLILILIYLFKSNLETINRVNSSNVKILIVFYLCLIPVTFAYNWVFSKSFWISLSCIFALLLRSDMVQENNPEDIKLKQV